MTSIGDPLGRTKEHSATEVLAVVPSTDVNSAEEIALGMDVPGVGRVGLWYRTRRAFGRAVVAAVAVSMASLPPVLLVLAAPGQAVLIVLGWLAISVALILLAVAERHDGAA